MNGRHRRQRSWCGFHSFNGTMHRPDAPPRLTLALPRSVRGYALDAPDLVSPRQSPIPQTAPLDGRGVPDLCIQPASATSPNFPEASVMSLSQLSTKGSYESFGFRDRSGSSETIRGITATPAAETATDTPSTQRFDAEEVYPSERSPLQRGYSPFIQADGGYGSLIYRRSPSRGPSAAVTGTTSRRMLSSVMHGVILAIQGAVALAVFSALIWVTIWQKSDSDPEFWNW